MIYFINSDNMGDAGLPVIPTGFFDWAIVDPPYGINAHEGVGSTMRIAIKKGKVHGGEWDSATPSDEYFKQLQRVSKNRLIFGANYFKQTPLYNPKLKRLPEFRKIQTPGAGAFVWAKGATMYGRDFNEAEVAWVSTLANYWHELNPTQKNRHHPTQKPVKLYRWILKNICKGARRVLDTHGGSFTLAIAAEMEGVDLYIYERDPVYFNKGLNAFKRHFAQGVLF